MKLLVLLSFLTFSANCLAENLEGTYSIQEELKDSKTNFVVEVTEIKTGVYTINEKLQDNVINSFEVKCSAETCKQIANEKTRNEKYFCSQMEVNFEGQDTLEYKNNCLGFSATYRKDKETKIAEVEAIEVEDIDLEEQEIKAVVESIRRSPSQQKRDKIAAMEADEAAESQNDYNEIEWTYENVL